VANEKIIKSVNGTLAIGSNIVESAESEVVWLAPPPMLAYACFGLNEKIQMLIEGGALNAHL